MAIINNNSGGVGPAQFKATRANTPAAGAAEPQPTESVQISGISLAAPMVAGTVANMLQANPALTPDEVKTILQETSTGRTEVSLGQVNPEAAVKAAVGGFNIAGVKPTRDASPINWGELDGVHGLHSTKLEGLYARRSAEPLVATVDTGVDISQPGERLVAWKDFVEGRPEPYDPSGQGTHVAGCILGNDGYLIR